MTTASRAGRHALRLAARWELLIISLLLVAIYVTRHTGSLPGSALRLLDDVLIAVVVILALSLAGGGRTTTVVHVAIAALAVAIAVVELAASEETLIRISEALTGYLVAVSGFLVFRLVLRQRRVAGDTLFGALAVYLAVGVLFGLIFTSMARTSPDAFSPPQPVIDGETTTYYFSFVTLTGLGYGDIAPNSDGTQILATLEAIIGIILLAALVGRIVGLLVAQATNSANGPSDAQPWPGQRRQVRCNHRL